MTSQDFTNSFICRCEIGYCGNKCQDGRYQCSNGFREGKKLVSSRAFTNSYIIL